METASILMVREFIIHTPYSIRGENRKNRTCLSAYQFYAIIGSTFFPFTDFHSIPSAPKIDKAPSARDT